MRQASGPANSGQAHLTDRSRTLHWVMARSKAFDRDLGPHKAMGTLFPLDRYPRNARGGLQVHTRALARG